MPQDYVALFRADHGTEILHSGVKGMKWGVRNKSINSGPGDPKFHKGEIVKLKALNKTIASGKLPSKTGTPDHLRIARINGHIKAHQITLAKIASGGKLTSTPVAGKAHVRNRGTKTANNTTIPPHSSDESSKARYDRLKKQVDKKGAHSLDNEELQFLNARTAAIQQAQKLIANKESWLSKTIKITIDQAIQSQLKKTTNQLMTKHVGNRITTRLNLPPTPTPTPTPTP